MVEKAGAQTIITMWMPRCTISGGYCAFELLFKTTGGCTGELSCCHDVVGTELCITACDVSGGGEFTGVDGFEP